MENKTLMLRRLILAFAAVFCVFFMTSGNAFAGDNDFKLSRLCDEHGCANEQAINDFKTLGRAYASLLAPMHFQPASTLGEEGFEIAVESKMSFSTEDNSSWKATNKNDTNEAKAKAEANGGKYEAPDLFATIQLHMRKGLPFSFEVEGVFNWLANSEIFYVGAGLRWAITEGWWFLPDLSVRAHAGTIVGASEISLINVNCDVALSYTWGLGGIASITPYGGYSLLTTWASSRPLLMPDAKGDAFESVFRRQQQFLHRGFVGVQLKGDFFVFGVEGELGKQVMSVGLKIGADF
ncbi:MAG: hypothetical protein J6A01_03935 [Proteobacteria bacterium]|nr:hypothetical protein [Pseudomonadota bacterium]